MCSFWCCYISISNSLCFVFLKKKNFVVYSRLLNLFAKMLFKFADIWSDRVDRTGKRMQWWRIVFDLCHKELGKFQVNFSWILTDQSWDNARMTTDLAWIWEKNLLEVEDMMEILWRCLIRCNDQIGYGTRKISWEEGREIEILPVVRMAYLLASS